MKVLSNLLGNNTKINANVIALKDTNNNPYTLDDWLTGETLWTNPNPTSSFSAQTITLSSDGYDFLEIYYCSPVMNSIYTNTVLSTKILKGYNGVLNFAGNGSSAGTQYNMNFYRQVNRNSDKSFSITSCVYYWGSNSASNDAFLIPLKIIGYKQNLS